MIFSVTKKLLESNKNIAICNLPFLWRKVAMGDEDKRDDWKIPDFEKHETLGTGTFGRVYLVTHPSDHSKFYAMKILQKSVIVRLKQVQHTLNEKEVLLQSRDCPFIVTLFVFIFYFIFILFFYIVSSCRMYSNVFYQGENISRR